MSPKMDKIVAESAKVIEYPKTRGRKIGSLIIRKPSDALQREHVPYIVKGLMAPREISVWYSPPSVGKSFFMLHVAERISKGESIAEHRVKPTRTLYLSLEGEGGFETRIEALVKERGLGDGNFF